MKRSLVLSAAVLAALPLAGAPDADARVTRKGRTVVSFKDGNVEAILGYRWMNDHPEATWVPLQLAVSAATDRVTVEIAREDVALVTPKGQRIALPQQKAFGEVARHLTPVLEQLRISRDPIDGYFPGRTIEEPLRFFTVPGETTTYDSVTVSRNILAEGLLWFPVPAGVTPGRWRLEIKSKFAQVEIPFDVPAPPLKKKGAATDEGVTW